MTPTPGSPEELIERPHRWRMIAWLAASLLAAVALSLTASFAPPVLKRLGLYYAVYGIATGFVWSWLAREIRPPRSRWLPILGALIGLLGALNMGWLSYGQFRQARLQYAQQHPKDAASLAMLERLSETDPELRLRYQEERQRLDPDFADYLVHRVSSLGDWNLATAATFWGGEVAIATILSGWVFSRSQKRPCPSED
jgi:4-amino-4-deoxy-L-arabinose transferase-like glycosyltransferase